MPLVTQQLFCSASAPSQTWTNRSPLLSRDLPYNLPTSYRLFVRPCRSRSSQDGELPAHPLSRSSFSGGGAEEPTLPNTEFTSKIGNCLHPRQRQEQQNNLEPRGCQAHAPPSSLKSLPLQQESALICSFRSAITFPSHRLLGKNQNSNCM